MKHAPGFEILGSATVKGGVRLAAPVATVQTETGCLFISLMNT